jgi:hypothetical protein
MSGYSDSTKYTMSGYSDSTKYTMFGLLG